MDELMDEGEGMSDFRDVGPCVAPLLGEGAPTWQSRVARGDPVAPDG